MINRNEDHRLRAAQEREQAGKSDDVAVRSAHLELARLHDLARGQALDDSDERGFLVSAAMVAKPLNWQH